MNSPFYISHVITPSNIGATDIARIRKGCDIHDVTIHVLEAFNGSATLEIGTSGNADGFSTSQSITTTGRKRPTLGSDVGYQSAPHSIIATLGGTPTQGLAIVVVEGKLLPESH